MFCLLESMQFFGCSSLTELHLNDGVAMYNEAFADCTSLKKVYSKGILFVVL